MYEYKTKIHYLGMKGTSVIKAYFEDDEIAALDFYCTDKFIIIEDIQIYARFKVIHEGEGIGTSLFNYMLIYLNENQVVFNKVIGRLSSIDAYNRNWIRSIPFYLHCHEYFKNLPYSLYTIICDGEATIYTSNDYPTMEELEALCKYYSAINRDLKFIIAK